MAIQVLPSKFLIKINKQKQKYFKEHTGLNSVIYAPVGNTFESKNLEHGIILQAGAKAAEVYGYKFKIGYCIIFHWRVEANDKNTREQFFVMEDLEWNYYIVDVSYTRGIFDGNKITPHPDYIFLKNVSALPTEGEYDEMYKTHLKKTESGLLMFSKWEDSPLDIADKIERLKNKIQSLGKSKRTPETTRAIAELEKERQDLNRKSQKAAYLPYKVAYSSSRFNELCDTEVVEDDIIYCWNKGCLYITNFQNNPAYKYIIVSLEHVGFLYRKIKEAVDTYEERRLLSANEYA